MPATISPMRSPIAVGIYSVPVEYTMVLQTALRTLEVRSTEPDRVRKGRITAMARKWAQHTARAINGEIAGYFEVHPDQQMTTWGSTLLAIAVTALRVVETITNKADDATVLSALARLVEATHTATSPITR